MVMEFTGREGEAESVSNVIYRMTMCRFEDKLAVQCCKDCQETV